MNLTQQTLDTTAVTYVKLTQSGQAQAMIKSLLLLLARLANVSAVFMLVCARS